VAPLIAVREAFPPRARLLGGGLLGGGLLGGGLLGGGLLFALAGCASRPPGMEGCAAVKDPVAQEECRYTAAKALVGDERALLAAVAAIPEQASRDLLLYRLAFDHPARAGALCAKVQTPDLREKCGHVLGRPHLAGAP
jgi:hypothetical protein